MLPSKPYGHTLFCDDIRQEFGGKISLMGIYGEEMRIPEPQCVLARLGLLIIYKRNVSEPRAPEATVDIFLPGEQRLRDQPSYSYGVNFEHPEHSSFEKVGGVLTLQSTIQILLSPVFIREPGRIAVHIKTEGYDNIPFGRLLLVRDVGAPKTAEN